MEEDNCCDICLENYNSGEKTPKKMECCTKVYCLTCLKDIFKKNCNKILCPICRKITVKNPSELKMDNESLEPKTVCPCCYKSLASRNLRIKITKMGGSTIMCSYCYTKDESQSLKEYIVNLSEEMDYFLTSFCSFNKEIFDSTLEFNLNSQVDNIMNNLKKNLKEKLKLKVINLIGKKYDIDLSNGLLSEEFNKHHLILNNIKKTGREIKNTDYINIKTAIDFYINKSDLVRKNGISLKKALDNVNSPNLINFDENFEKITSLENFISNILTINIEKQNFNSFNNFTTNENWESNQENTHTTGLNFIDNKISNLKQENDKLNSLLLKKDLEIQMMEIQAEQGSNNYTYSLFSENNKQAKNKFDYQNLYIQNFNFSVLKKNNLNNYGNVNNNNATGGHMNLEYFNLIPSQTNATNNQQGQQQNNDINYFNYFDFESKF